MNSSAHRKELGHFLKAHRAELGPRTVGPPETDRRRRVAGLRRDEVAVLATISTNYYTRLEQGRTPPPRNYDGLRFLSSWAAAQQGG
ncbi:hypothetical protein BEK98_25285 [Streptomyces diastatochromogenes]|uniref:Transcriptional regulator n=1 Tax=Streptomyces diastatochromogenes TaxID=42236 RepID=A0A233SBA0_STRDA|nr:hypothetical protein BEK98_25285 [Streptomyces diastatochromogenes]